MGPMPLLEEVEHEQLNDLPQGIVVMLVGGISGSVVSSLCRAGSKMLQASDIAVARLDANRFHGTSIEGCDVCYECKETKDCGEFQCHTSAEAIDIHRLNAAIHREVLTLYESEAFVGGI